MKKGAEKTLVFMILAVIGLIILFAVTKLWADKAEGGFDKETCRASVTMVALSKLGGGGTWLDLKCSTERKYFKKEKKEEIMNLLVKSMKDCWYQYGSGKIDFTSNWDWMRYHDYCFVCSVFSFDTRNEPITIENLKPYLLTTFKPGENLKTGDIRKDLKIEPDNPIYIIYGITKDFKIEKSFWKAAKAVLTLGAYKEGQVPFLVVANSDDIKEERCDGWYIDSKLSLKRIENE